MSAAPDADAALDPSTRANLEAILAVARELPSAEDAGVGGRNAAVLGQIAELAADIERVLDVADGFERLEAPPPPPRIAVLCGSTTDGGAADGTGAGYEGTLGDVDPDFEPILRAALPDGAVLVPYEEAIAAGDCVGALTVTHAHVSDALLEKLGPKLRVVSNYGVGVNHVDLEACARRGVKVGHTPGVLADATADLAWALLLACARRVPECDAYARSPAFVAYDNMAFLGCDVAGKTLGVVGMGSIGGEVARRALGFKMETLYFNRTRRPEAVERELKATWVPRLADLLPRCDFVVVVCPLTPATAGLLGAATLPLMRDGSVLVNVSRGGVVDQAALLAALDGPGGLARAGLDVSSPEPLPPGHALRGHAKVVWTPHRGSATTGARRAMAELAAANLALGVAGAPLAHCCNGL